MDTTWTCSCKEVKTHPMTKAVCYRCFDERDDVIKTPEWKMNNLRFYLTDVNNKRVFEGSYNACDTELNRLIDTESGYWYMYDETDPDEAWQSGGQADLAEAADIIEWIGEIPTALRHDPFEMTGTMNNADYDDLRNYAIGR